MSTTWIGRRAARRSLSTLRHGRRFRMDRIRVAVAPSTDLRIGRFGAEFRPPSSARRSTLGNRAKKVASRLRIKGVRRRPILQRLPQIYTKARSEPTGALWRHLLGVIMVETLEEAKTEATDATPVGAGSQTLTRGLDVIEAVPRRELPLGQLADYLELTKSTTHRLAGALIDRGYLAFTPGSARNYSSSVIWRMHRPTSFRSRGPTSGRSRPPPKTRFTSASSAKTVRCISTRSQAAAASISRASSGIASRLLRRVSARR